MGFKKVIVWLVVILISLLGITFFVTLLYQLEALHDAGKPIYQHVNEHGLSGLKIGEVFLLSWTLIVVVCLLVLLQFFKSVFDKSIKKKFDAGAEELVDKFEKWAGK